MINVFTKFYSGAYVTDLDPGERAALDRLYNASYIDIRMVDGREFAEASALGRQFKLRDRGTKKRRCVITLGRWLHERTLRVDSGIVRHGMRYGPFSTGNQSYHCRT